MVFFSLGFDTAETNAQVIFQNPSFEGTPADGQAPPNWFICSGTPDIQPGFWGTTQIPSDGTTYLGFHHEESVSAYFPNGIGLCSGLQFTMDVSIVPLNLPGNSTWESNNQGVNPGYICIYGGFSSCDFQELLWQSDLLTNVSNWQSIDIQLTATQNFTYLNFAPCVNTSGSWTYFGIDNIQGVVTDPVPVDVSPPQTVCIGQPIQLSASLTGATSYSWTGPNGFMSNEQNPTIPAASAANSGTYTVTANVGTCQSAPTTAVVTVNGSVPVDAGPPQTVCIGQPINLSASFIGATSYSWTGPNGFTSNEQNPTIPAASAADSGPYTLTVTDAGGCTASWDTVVTVLPNSGSQQSVSICEGETYALTDGTVAAQAGTYLSVLTSTLGCDSTVVLDLIVNQSTSSFTNASACVNYFWNGQTYSQSGAYTYQTLNASGCDSIANLNLVINGGAETSFTVNACGSYTWSVNGQTYTQSGSYTEVLSTVAGCDSVVTLNITIEPEYNIILNQSICEGQEYYFEGLSYTQSGTYVSELTTLAGCDSTVTLNLTVNPLPQLDIDSIYTICTGQAVVLSGPELNQGSMLWNTGETGRSITVSQSGDYVLSVVNPQGCQASGVYTVLEYPVPNPVLNRDFVFCPGEELFLDAGNPGSTYLWNDGSTDRIVPLVRPGFYTVLITNDAGCQLSAFAQVIDYCDPVIYVPSSFTPDNDGVNDYFLAVGEYIDEFEMTIYNRWGELIFQGFDINRGWDGSFLGGDFFIPDLIATWLIRYKPQPAPGTSEAHWRELKGHVVILR
jgi:gliding motility-associated-like protein